MSTKNFVQFLAADRRLSILLILLNCTAYKANMYFIKAVLDDMAHKVSSDVLSTDLFWLSEQGLLELTEAIGLQVATLTSRGQDVAEGRATVPGIKRPSAGV